MHQVGVVKENLFRFLKVSNSVQILEQPDYELRFLKILQILEDSYPFYPDDFDSFWISTSYGTVVDPRFVPVGENVVLPNVPFTVKITEKRMYKVIHWSFDATKGKFVPDCSKVGNLAVTDWNEVSVDVVSDSPDFKGVKVKSEGGGVFVEYINIQSVRISVKTMEGLRGSLPNCDLSGKFLSPDDPHYYDGEEYTCKFVGGYPADNRSGGYYQFGSTSVNGIGYPCQITFLEIIPNNTSWRTFDVENTRLSWYRENWTESEYKKKEKEWLEAVNCYIKLYKLDYLPYGKSMDWDELKGKVVIPSAAGAGHACLIPLTSPTYSKSEQTYSRGGIMTATFSY